MNDVRLNPTLTKLADGFLFTFRYQPTARDLRYIVQRSKLENGDIWTEIYRYDTSTGLITEIGATGDENATTQIISITGPAQGLNFDWRLVVERVP